MLKVAFSPDFSGVVIAALRPNKTGHPRNKIGHPHNKIGLPHKLSGLSHDLNPTISDLNHDLNLSSFAHKSDNLNLPLST